MKGLRLYLIGSTVALILYLVAQYYKPEPTNWSPSYLKEDKIPFGAYILFQELQSIFPGTKVETTRLPVYNTLKGKHFENTAYLFVAGGVKFDKYDYKELTKYMREGNDVFIASFNLDKLLSDTLKLKITASFDYTDYTKKESGPINFVNPALRINKGYVFDKGLGDQHFSKLDTARATVLGRNSNGEVNFVKYTFGKGALYILPNPQLLTNYNLLNPKGAEYAAKALAYLAIPGRLIWDENNTIGSTDDNSILRALLRHAPLRWAYYLSLTGLVLFVFFEMKRRQRIIPVIEPLKNTTVDFVKVVGKVYYQQRDNSDIVQKKISYFLEHIRTTYRLKTTTIDEEFIGSVVLKSGVHETTVNALFTAVNDINGSPTVSDDQLINLNKLIEKFYKQAQ